MTKKGRSFTQTRLFWAIMLAVIIGMLAYGRWNNVRRLTFSASASGVQSADLDLELGAGIIDIHAGDGAALLDAEIVTTGAVEFTEDGGANANITLEYFEPTFLVRWLFGGGGAQLDWDIALSPDVPLSLRLRGGTGQITADLQDITLTALDIEGGVGDVSLSLPRTAERYPVDILANVGRLRVAVADDTTLSLNIEGEVGATEVTFGENVAADVTLNTGIGDVTLDVPDEAPVQVTAPGEVALPAWLEPTTEEAGVYQSAAYPDAARRLTITHAGGIGDFTVR